MSRVRSETFFSVLLLLKHLMSLIRRFPASLFECDILLGICSSLVDNSLLDSFVGVLSFHVLFPLVTVMLFFSFCISHSESCPSSQSCEYVRTTLIEFYFTLHKKHDEILVVSDQRYKEFPLMC